MNKKIPLYGIGSEDTEYLARISNNYKALSEAEKRVADYVIQSKADVLPLSIAALAEKSGTSTATVVRFCQANGFKGYTEFKFYIERQFLSTSGEHQSIEVGDSVQALKQKLFIFNKEVIDDTSYILDDIQVERAITALSDAGRVIIIGEGASGNTAQTACTLFMFYGINSIAYTDAFLQVMASNNLCKNDVVLAICHSGRIINTIDALQIARDRGATTICITGYANSPVTELSDIVLYCSSKHIRSMSELAAARISEICVVNLLQVGYMARNYEKMEGQTERMVKSFELKRL